VELIVGRPFEAAFPPPAPESDERAEVLVVDGLQGQSFGPVSFTLELGEIVGIAGAEGNGQPQLFDCLAGRQPPKAGRVVCDGKELSLISTHEAVVRGHAAARRPPRGVDAGARRQGERHDPASHFPGSASERHEAARRPLVEGWRSERLRQPTVEFRRKSNRVSRTSS
jgi:energy-coupling factor transporter ATP-binding protein EcfA2